MRKLTILGCLVIVLILAACSKQEEENEKPASKLKKEDNMEEEVHRYPFTGVETKEDPDDKAVAVMVSNVNAARPQTGLSKADVVFEMLTESNITRFMAIYQSESPEVVGPVRSAREYFFTLADGYDALYVYSGAANFINDMIKSRDIEHIEAGLYDNDGHLTVREPFRKSPHNMYLQYEAVPEVAEQKGYDMKGNGTPLPFLDEDEALPEDLPYEQGTYAKIDYYGSTPVVEYEYDEQSETYIRYNDGVKTTELETEIPIETDNILIVEAEHQVIDEEERREIDIESGGKAILLHRGKSLELEWKKEDGQMIPMLDGEEVPFVPGKTWINFVEKHPISGVEEQVKIGKD